MRYKIGLGVEGLGEGVEIPNTAPSPLSSPELGEEVGMVEVEVIRVWGSVSWDLFGFIANLMGVRGIMEGMGPGRTTGVMGLTGGRGDCRTMISCVDVALIEVEST